MIWLRPNHDEENYEIVKTNPVALSAPKRNKKDDFGFCRNQLELFNFEDIVAENKVKGFNCRLINRGFIVN